MVLTKRFASVSYFFIIFTVLFSLLFSAAAYAADGGIEDAPKSVVRVVVFDHYGYFLGWGSGFALGTEEPIKYIATNYHVVEPNIYGVAIWRSSDDLVFATVLHVLPNSDIAVLELEQPIYGIPPLEMGSKDMANVGDDIYTLGFPAGAIEDFTTSYPEDVTVTKGIISKITTWGGIGVYQIDASINPGNSGGPLLNSKGQVLGLNTFKMLDVDHINGAVQIDYLTDLLDSRGIKYKKAHDGGDASGQAAKTTESGLETETAAQPGQEGKAASPIKSPGGLGGNKLMIGLIAAGAVVVLVVLIIIIVAVSKGKSKPVPVAPLQAPSAGGTVHVQPTQPIQPSQPQMAPPQALGPKPILKGISGHFAGSKMELSGGRVAIGREPRLCQLVFPQSYTDISRKHCTVWYDEKTGSFGIEDSSSNGTYLSSNERLERGRTYFLKPGERFYLSDPKNVFEVNQER